MSKEKTEFKYTFRNSAKDFFNFNFGNVYHSWTAIVNVLFVFSFSVLAYTRWSEANGFGRSLIILGLLLFPVIQPLVIWLRAGRLARAIQIDTSLRFDETGLTIKVPGHTQHVDWTHFAGAVKRRSQLVVLPDAEHAYLLSNRAVGEEKEELYAFIQKHAKGSNK